MSGGVFALVLVLIGVICVLGFRLLIAAADLALMTEARDALANERSDLTIENAELKRENEDWRDSDRIRRLGSRA